MSGRPVLSVLLLVFLPLSAGARPAVVPPVPPVEAPADEALPIQADKAAPTTYARYDFDDAFGQPDAQGWTAYDLSVREGVYWHVDDFAGLAGYAPLAGSRSLWCGQRENPRGTGGTWPGYGNGWYQTFESVPFTVLDDVEFSFEASWDLEPDFDFAYVEYSVAEGSWITLATLNGTGSGPVSVNIGAAEHTGSVRLRLRVETDPAWSDADGLWDTNGALVIDNLVVRDLLLGIVDQQGFEAEAVDAGATADGHWVADNYPVYGLHAGLVAGGDVLQEDPLFQNATHFWGFFNGSPANYGCGGHPEQPAVPYFKGLGTASRDYFSNEIRSPWVRLDQDENGLPVATAPDSVSIAARIYHEMSLAGTVYYTARCRFRVGGAETEWVGINRLYYGDYKSWKVTSSLTFAAPAGADEVQVALEVADYGHQFNFGPACHTHAPLIDDIAIREKRVYPGGFTSLAAGLPGVGYGDVDWGDFDGDGDLDALLVGNTTTGRTGAVYRNDGGVFVLFASLAAVSHASAAWGDGDNDGDLDILLAGDSGSGGVTTYYRNDPGAFVAVPTALPALVSGFGDRALDWGDYDNDGDLDILVQGLDVSVSPAQRVCGIYRNDGAGSFSPVAAALPQVESGSLAWGDYDADGDLDLVLTGTSMSGDGTAAIFRNDGAGQFTDIAAPLPSLSDGGAAWGDYDADGDLDLALTGHHVANAGVSRIFRNDAGAFAEITTGLYDLRGGSADWCDYDADGDLDLLLTGWDGAVRYTQIFNNDEGYFQNINAGLRGLIYSSAGWGDVDNDGRPDVMVAGYNPTDVYRTSVYRAQSTTPNTPPSAPGGLVATATGGQVVLGWSPAADAQTPAAALTYNVRIGTTPGGSEICTAMAIPATGTRLVARDGNAGQRLARTLVLPDAPGPYYWSVQAIDGAFAGGPFAPEQSFLMDPEGFVDSAAALSGVTEPTLGWADVDGDGDLDLTVSGLADGSPASWLYENDGSGNFAPAGGAKGAASTLPGVRDGVAAWADHDGDGDVDPYLAGLDAGGSVTGGLYRNDAGAFTPLAGAVVAMAEGSADWGDCDADGDLDLLLTGRSAAQGRDTRLYRNDGGGAFSEIATTMPDVRDGGGAWGDYDGDGDLDILLGGTFGGGGGGPVGTTRVLANDGAGVFTDIAASLPQLADGDLAWGDADNDGDPDILLVGRLTGGTRTGQVLLNNGNGTFTAAPGAPDMDGLGGAWGDVDGDGDLDVLVHGAAGFAGNLNEVYLGDGAGSFTLLPAGAPGGLSGAVAFGDADRDGDLDVAIAGWDGAQAFTRIYLNYPSSPPNAPPTAPTNLRAQMSGGRLTLEWSAATDDLTPAAGLTYNLRVGTTPGGHDVVPAQSLAPSGVRLVDGRGNAQQRLDRDVVPPAGWTQLYCAVQAIDAGGAGSPFSAELALTEGWVAATPPAAPTRLHANTPNPFNPRTTIAFDLARDGVVHLEIFDAQGRRVRRLLQGTLAAGSHAAAWDGLDDAGRSVASGVYLCRMTADAFEQAVRMTLLR